MVDSIKERLASRISFLFGRNLDFIQLFFTLAVGLYFSIRICRAGFDISDEALYILSAKFPFEQSSSLGFSHLFTSVFWGLSHTTFLFRVSSILFSILISIIICVQTSILLSEYRSFSSKKAFPVILISYLSYGSIINFSPSYNLLVAWFAPVTLLAFLQFIYGEKPISLRFNLVTASTGLALILNIKFAVTFSILLLVLILLFSDLDPHKSKRLFRFALVSVAFIILLCFEYLLMLNRHFDFTFFRDGFRALQDLQPGGSGSHFLEVLLRSCKRLVYVFLILSSLIFLGRATQKMHSLLRFALVSGLLLSQIFYFKMYYASNANWTGQALAIHCLVFYCIWANRKVVFIQSKQRVLILGMLLLPYAMSFGTNNIYFEQTLFYLAPWGLIISLCNIRVFHKVSLKGALLYTTLLAYFLATSYYTPAYGLEESYSRNTRSVSLVGFGTIQISNHTKRLFENISDLKSKCNISSDDRFMGLQNLGGLAIPLNLVPLGNPWISSKLQAQINLQRDYPNHGLVLASRQSENQTAKFLPVELDFPKSFLYCGKVQDARNRFYFFWRKR